MEFSTTTLALIAIIAVIGLIGVVAIDIIILPQDVEAKGCQFPVLPSNVSQKLCS
jgi:Flp pilus assembly protein CpaB